MPHPTSKNAGNQSDTPSRTTTQLVLLITGGLRQERFYAETIKKTGGHKNGDEGEKVKKSQRKQKTSGP